MTYRYYLLHISPIALLTLNEQLLTLYRPKTKPLISTSPTTMTSSASTRRTTTAPSASTRRSRRRRLRQSDDRRQRQRRRRQRRHRQTLEHRRRVPRAGRMLRSSKRCYNKRASSLIRVLSNQALRISFSLFVTIKFFSVLV